MKGSPGIRRNWKLKVYRPDLGCWQLELTQGQWTLVDSCDIKDVSRFSWAARRRRSQGGYVVTGNKSKWSKLEYSSLARYLLQAKQGEVVDHINGNPLDNRRINLRLCTQSLNTRNARKRAIATSKYKGVCKKKGYRKPWIAQIQVNKKKISLGHYITEVEAARAYDEAAKKLHGTFAHLNFPPEGLQP